MKTSSRIVIDHPAARVDLAQWISTMTDGDYQACSRAHRAAGTFRESGALGMVNVESIGGHLLVQHYRATTLKTDQVVMRSTKSRVYVMHVLPATIEVIWTMEAKPRDGQSVVFICSVETRMAPLWRILSTSALLPIFLRQHTEEETRGFAADISRKINAGLLDGRAA